MVDDRKRIHTELRHFIHTLVLRCLKTKITVEIGVYSDPKGPARPALSAAGLTQAFSATAGQD